MIKQVALLLLFFTLLACNKGVEDKPIARQDFVNLLIDLHKFDAVASDYSLNAEMVIIDSATLYSSILNKYNTNKDEFETTMQWYSKHPEELAEIYDEVFAQLDKQNTALNNESSLFVDNNNERIFSDTKYKSLRGDTIKYPAPYLIEIKDTGTYLIELKARLLKEDSSTDPFLSIYFIKDKADLLPEERLYVTKTSIPKTNYTRDYQFTYDLDQTGYKYIKIIYPDTPDRNMKKIKNVQISKVRVLMRKNNSEVDPAGGKSK